MSSKEFWQLAEETIFDSKFKNVLHVESQNLYIFNLISNGKLLSRILKETFYLEMSGMAMNGMQPRNHKFFETIDTKIQQLLASGHIGLFTTYWNLQLKPKFYEKYNPNEGPTKLTMEHLRAGFVVWIISLWFAVVAFVVEWVFRSVELLMWKFILLTFYELRDPELMNVPRNIKIEATSHNVVENKNDLQEDLHIESMDLNNCETPESTTDIFPYEKSETNTALVKPKKIAIDIIKN